MFIKKKKKFDRWFYKRRKRKDVKGIREIVEGKCSDGQSFVN
jgi:hypothetical protein